jgi:hypothetical protein
VEEAVYGKEDSEQWTVNSGQWTVDGESAGRLVRGVSRGEGQGGEFVDEAAISCSCGGSRGLQAHEWRG